MATYFVADLNFNGDNARHAHPFGFTDSTEITRRICEIWKTRVAADDTVWIVGNVGNPVHLAGLPGVKHLVRGAGDPQAWNCLATRRYASVSDRALMETAHGLLTLVSDPIKAGEGAALVLHGRAPGDWTRPGFTCVAAECTGWGPMLLDDLLHTKVGPDLRRAA